MSIIKPLLFFTLIFISTACGFLIGQQNGNQIIAENKPAKINPDFELFKQLGKKNIRTLNIGQDDDENKKYFVVQKTNEPPIEEHSFSTSDKLTVYDNTGKILYEHRDFGIENIQFGRFVSPTSSEMFFETNGGGTDSNLKILSYKDGKFKEIIDESETQFRGGYFEMLQYRTGMKSPYFKPSQLIVIEQIGGADDNPSASVFRTVDNKFQKVGEFKMQELGDFIESKIQKPNNN